MKQHPMLLGVITCDENEGEESHEGNDIEQSLQFGDSAGCHSNTVFAVVEGGVVFAEERLAQDHVGVIRLGLANVKQHLMTLLLSYQLLYCERYAGILDFKDQCLLQQMLGAQALDEPQELGMHHTVLTEFFQESFQQRLRERYV